MNVVSILLLVLAGMFYFAPEKFLNKDSPSQPIRMMFEYSKMIALGCVAVAVYVYSLDMKPATAEVSSGEVSSVSETTRTPELSDEVFKNE